MQDSEAPILPPLVISVVDGAYEGGEGGRGGVVPLVPVALSDEVSNSFPNFDHSCRFPCCALSREASRSCSVKCLPFMPLVRRPLCAQTRGGFLPFFVFHHSPRYKFASILVNLFPFLRACIHFSKHVSIYSFFVHF